jgi:hypothetical protein
MSQQFVFNNKGVQFYRAETNHMHDFESVIQYFTRQGAGRAQAINLARKTHPDRYNEWMKAGRRATTAARMMVADKPVQVMDMRKPGGVPVITFRGL